MVIGASSKDKLRRQNNEPLLGVQMQRVLTLEFDAWNVRADVEARWTNEGVRLFHREQKY